MQVYSVNAAFDGSAVVLTTVDTATMALARVRLAMEQYARVWVTDDVGEHVNLHEIHRLADLERSKTV